MAIQKRVTLEFGEVFPNGAFLKGEVAPVDDFNVARREDGSRPQAIDKDTGELLWQAVVIDADDAASKRETSLSVKFAARVRPVPPENKTPFPFTPVELVGLTGLPYVDDSGNGRPRVAWSLRADDMVTPGGGKSLSASASGGKSVA